MTSEEFDETLRKISALVDLRHQCGATPDNDAIVAALVLLARVGLDVLRALERREDDAVAGR